MTQEGDGMGAQAIPPSFMPAGSRRRPETAGSAAPAAAQSVAKREPSSPLAITGDGVGGGMRRVAIPHADASRRASTPPPSFSPAARRSSSSSSRSQRSRLAGDGGQDAQPRSFSPRISSSQHAGASSDSAHRGSTPRRTRRSAGSTSFTSPASSAAFAAENRVMSRSFAADGHAEEPFTSPIRRHGGAGRRLLIAVALLLVALLLAVFGAWNWVDSRLNKEDGWLTSMANTHGESWLIIGSDERDGTVGGTEDDVPGFRTDTILVLTKPNNGPSSLISIPRDSLVKVDGSYMKINAVAQLAGGKALVGTVEGITDQKIDHIAKIKFGGLKNVVDALGGVRLCYDQTVNDANSGMNWTAGCHTADGGTALAFSRMRYSDANGDFGRAQRQREVIAAIMKKAVSKDVLLNPATLTKTADTSLQALTVDDGTDPLTLLSMALAFKDATGSKGVNGSVYWTNPDYRVNGVGSSVLLDDARNTELFAELAAGTHAAGAVGTLAESQQS